MSEAAPTRLMYRDERPLERRLTTYRLAVRGPLTGSGEPATVASIEVDVSVCRIGSREGNHWVIGDDSVSRVHASIEATPQGYLVRDLGSTNGTFVAMGGAPTKGEPEWLRVREALLPPRPLLLRVGSVWVDFVPAAREVTIPLSEVDRFGAAVGRSAAMRELFATLDRAATKDVTILLEGESGTGKEVLAEAIHGASSRRGQPFVVFDCSAVPESLMESELVGHERGAFTGATSARPGRFEEADGGTLFLDELGELPLELQPKLLRALERREVRRVGGTRTVPVDVRIIAATNRDLAKEVNRGTFREDLYYRLAVLPIRVVPLRERPEDLPLLVERFVRRACRDEPARGHRVLGGITPATWRALAACPWRGNVRELRNLVERCLALGDTLVAPSGELDASAVDAAPPSASSDSAAPASAGVEPRGPDVGQVDLSLGFGEVKAAWLEQVERRYLRGQLARHHGNLSAAARASGLDRMYFKRLLKKYSL
jgi:transcriptional regulator with GAF, ATPase, and Fis domain